MIFYPPTEMNTAVLNWATPGGDDTIAYLARQSAPKNQALTRGLQQVISYTSDEEELTEAKRELAELTRSLIQFASTHGHYSIFEQASMSVTVKTTRAISAQLLRHHSFRFQEFSQRYAAVSSDIPLPELRYIDGAKRNPSVNRGENRVLTALLQVYLWVAKYLYNFLLSRGIHPESARMFLPLCTPTTLTVTANVRDWIFYLKNRTSLHAQKEHQDLALSISEIFEKEFPITYEAVYPLITND